MRNDSFENIAKVLKKGKSCLIFTHIVMDGDAIGSAAALCLAMRNEGIDAYVVTEDELAKNLSFLGKDLCIDVAEAEKMFSDGHDISVCVDCSEESRFPKRAALFNNGAVKVCIDHHKTADAICDYNYVDPEAGATAQLIYKLIKAMGTEIDKDMAVRIYAGIATDTGNFQYSNTTKETHQIVSELYDICDSFHEVSVEIYENEPFAKLKLQSEIFDGAELFAGGKAVIASVTQDMLKRCGAVMDDSEGTVSRLRALENVEVAALLRENEDGSIKASLRAKTYADVSELCASHGGGGHAKAAGFTEYGNPEKIRETLKKEIEEKIIG